MSAPLTTDLPQLAGTEDAGQRQEEAMSTFDISVRTNPDPLMEAEIQELRQEQEENLRELEEARREMEESVRGIQDDSPAKWRKPPRKTKRCDKAI